MPFTFKNKQKAVAVFFMVGTFLMVVLGVLIAKQSDLIVSKMKYYTIFTDAHGFSGGTNITYKGFKIGRITSLSLTEENKIQANLYIYKKYERLITRYAVLKVQTSFLGTSSLELVTFQPVTEVEKEAEEKAAQEDPLYEKELITENETTPEETLAEDREGEEDKKENKVSETLDTIQEKFVSKRKLILSSDMPQGQEILRQRAAVTAAGDELTSKVARLLEDVHSLKPELQSSLANISVSMEHLSVILASLRGSGRTPMGDSVLAILKNTAETSKNLKELSDALNSTDNSIGYLARDNKKLANQIETVMTNMEAVSKDLKTFSESTVGDKEEMERLVRLLDENLVEMKRLVKGMQRVFPYKEKDQDKD